MFTSDGPAPRKPLGLYDPALLTALLANHATARILVVVRRSVRAIEFARATAEARGEDVRWFDDIVDMYDAP